MQLEDALKLIKEVCANVQANLQTHLAIQQGLKVIEEAIKKHQEQQS